VINGLFVFNRCKSFQRKKPRGIDRVASSILKEGIEFEPGLISDGCHYFDHWHLDWDGVGDFNPKIRLITIEAHMKVFAAIAKESGILNSPFQLFISLARRDAGQDAVYLHTPNPHSPFPAEFDDVKWGVPELEQQLSAFLPQFQFIAGLRDFNYVAFAKGLGVPLSASLSA
jgi:hypothetical protein